MHLAGKIPSAQAFNVPKQSKVIHMFRADLADALIAWLQSHTDAQERLPAEQSTLSRWIATPM